MANALKQGLVLFQLAVPLFLFFTAIGKLLAWGEFEASLATFKLVPEPMRAAAAVLVPMAETAAFVLFVLRLRAWANVLCFIILAVFLLVTLWHWLANVPPDCACMGLWARYWQLDETAIGVMARDSWLMGYIVVVLLLTAFGRWNGQLQGGSAYADAQTP